MHPAFRSGKVRDASPLRRQKRLNLPKSIMEPRKRLRFKALSFSGVSSYGTNVPDDLAHVLLCCTSFAQAHASARVVNHSKQKPSEQ